MDSLHLNFISSVYNGNVCHSSELEKNKEFNNNYAKSINNKRFHSNSTRTHFPGNWTRIVKC